MKRGVSSKARTFRVGELAAATGVTVRTLHHYEETGLLKSFGRTDGGHRVFDSNGVEKIYQIRALRELGFSLVEIGEVLDAGTSIDDLLTAHLAAVEQEVERLRLLRARLRSLTSRNYAAGDLGELIAALEAMSCVERHRKQRGSPISAEIRRGEAWCRLGKALRANIEAGLDPLDERNMHIAEQAKSLIEEWSDRDPQVLAALKKLRTLPPPAPEEFAGWDASLMSYLSAAIDALTGKSAPTRKDTGSGNAGSRL